MENTNSLPLTGREVGRECKKAVSRCNFSVFIYLLVVSIAASVLTVGIGIVLGVVFGEGATAIIGDPFWGTVITWSLQILCMYIISYPVFHSLIKHLPKRDISEKENLSFGEFIKVFLATQALMFVGSIAATSITNLINVKLGIVVEDSTAELISGTPIWIVILVAVVIGPIFEELIFRKGFIDAIGNYNSRIAIFVSAASFALFHGNITQAIYTFGVGLMLSWVYTKTKNIIYPIALHMLMNFFGSVPTLLIADSYDRVMALPEDTLMGEITDPQLLADIAKVNAVGFMQYGFIIVGGIFLLSMIFGGFFKLNREGEVKIPFFRKLGVLIFNSGTIIFVIYSLINIVLNIFLPVINQYIENLGA
jgi:membrane protease YdiL (CAAX protease family)